MPPSLIRFRRLPLDRLTLFLKQPSNDSVYSGLVILPDRMSSSQGICSVWPWNAERNNLAKPCREPAIIGKTTSRKINL